MPKNQPLSPELFVKTLDRLIEMVVIGKEHVKIGHGLGQTLQGDPAIAQVAPVFWGMSLTAHLDAAELIAFKLFDTRAGTMTIGHLLAEAGKLKNAFGNATPLKVEAIVRIAHSQITERLTSPLKQIRSKRNRLLAHLDRTTVSDPEKVAEQVKVTFSDLNVIFDVAGRVLNDVSVVFCDVSPSYDMMGSEDYKRAIDLIVDAKCAQIRNCEAEF